MALLLLLYHDAYLGATTGLRLLHLRGAMATTTTLLVDHWLASSGELFSAFNFVDMFLYPGDELTYQLSLLNVSWSVLPVLAPTAQLN